jgi:hypothetical protein
MIVRVVLLLALVVGVLVLFDALADEPTAVAAPPFIVRMDASGVVRLPDGTLWALPAGAEIDACGGPPLRYALPTRVVHITSPCTGVFGDGFEAR